jgi:hypothetical protein
MDAEQRAAATARLRAGLAAYRAKGGKLGRKPGRVGSRDELARQARDDAKAALANGSPTSVPVVRDHHHRIARLIASGMRSHEIAAAVGVGIARISELRNDPVMVQLIAKYGERYDAVDEEIYATRRQKEERVLHGALDMLIERYEKRPHEITHEQARLDYALMREGMDAQIVKPSVVLHGNVSDMPLAELVALQRARADRMLAEIKPEPGSLLGPAVSADTGPGSDNVVAAIPDPVPVSTSDADASNG